MKAFLALLLITLCLGGCVVGLSVLLLTTTGNHPGTKAIYFLQWLPGISIALLSGIIGAFFNGLMEIWRAYSRSGAIPREIAPPNLVRFVIRPFLGAIAGVILFLFFAAGSLSLGGNPETSTGTGSLGAVIFQLTPRTPAQFSTTVLLTFVGGYFFPLVPSLLDIYRKSMFSKLQPPSDV